MRPSKVEENLLNKSPMASFMWFKLKVVTPVEDKGSSILHKTIWGKLGG